MGNRQGQQNKRTGGESGIVFPATSEITATMAKSFYPFAIADTFEMAAMKFDGGYRSPQQPKHAGFIPEKSNKISNKKAFTSSPD
jgi:hypothetical protein